MELYTTRRGKTGINIDGCRFVVDRATEKTIFWKCHTKTYKARCTSDTEMKEIKKPPSCHNHEKEDLKTVHLNSARAELKRKATEDLSERPVKMFCQQLISTNQEFDINDAAKLRFSI